MIYYESNEKEYFIFYERIAKRIKPKVYIGVLGGGTQHYHFIKYSKIAILVDINLEQISYIKDYRDGNCNFIAGKYSKYPIYPEYVLEVCLSKGDMLKEVSFAELINGNILYLPVRRANLIYLSNVLDYIIDKYYRNENFEEGIEIIVNSIERLLLEAADYVLFLNMYPHLWEMYLKATLLLEGKYKVERYLNAYVVGKT